MRGVEVFVDLPPPFRAGGNISIIPAANHSLSPQDAEVLFQFVAKFFITVRIRIEDLDRLSKWSGGAVRRHAELSLRGRLRPRGLGKEFMVIKRTINARGSCYG